MSEPLKLGQRVEVSGKGVQGVIAFMGKTGFAQGTWIGLVLDEPKGKNNGTVKGQEYFKCDENHGMFVKENQLLRLDEHGKPVQVQVQTPGREISQSKIARSRQSISRISLASSRHSLAGSRQSLSSSRQSLTGSRTQLDASNTDKQLDLSDSNTPKRASFVETGFVETLKPQFTPGQAMTTTPTPVTSVDDKMGIMQMQQELEKRAQQITDLNEKLETLKTKRLEDKEKLKNYDKLNVQLEQLVEFKSKILSAQASLQRELQKAKQEAKEAVEAKEQHAEEVADLSEVVEMATLDKEMAEEKADTLQLELEVCKEKLEEVQLDLEILKAEMQEKSADSTGSGDQMSAYEIKQLQQQNARLRETLVRLRDVSAHEKHEYQKLLKDIDQKKSEIEELGKTKEKLSARVEEMERQIGDLQEQVDAALGAEEMVVILGDQKFTLEEEVSQLREEVAELEALQDMNDQLVESNAELEADLREELDMAQSATREALRERDAALETIADREQTIGKFRQLVQQLQEQSMDLQRRLETETSKPVSALPEIVDFKKMFTETKAHTKAIDLELRRIDVEQLRRRVELIAAYLPESFASRGGDQDAISAVLLLPRLIRKSDIVLGQVKDKFGKAEGFDRNDVVKGHAVNQYAFKCRMSFYVYALQIILHQYHHVLCTGTPEVLLKAAAVYPEMAGQEKVIDDFVELLKTDRLDENVSTEALEKCVGYFNALFPALFGADARLNHAQLLVDNVKCLTSATDCLLVDSTAIRCLMENNKGDMELLVQHIISSTDKLQQQLKLIKRRLPLDGNITNLGLDKEACDDLYRCYQQALKVSKTLQDMVRSAVHMITSSGESEKSIAHEKMKETAVNASEKFYEQDDLGPVQSVKNSLNFIQTRLDRLAQFLHDNECEITAANRKEEKPVPPVKLRAEAVKKELEQTKTLTGKLENKESDLKELKKLLKEKLELLSEMTIRKELAEKKLGNVNKDYELTIEKLQRKLDEAHNNYKKKEKEFEETLDHLQTDIDSLENEKGEMKEKLRLLSKKAQLEGHITKGTPSSQLPSLQSGPTLPSVVKDSPLLLQEIDNLRKLFHNERNERIRLQNLELQKQLGGMKPLPQFKTSPDEAIEKLMKEGIALHQEVLSHLAKPSFPSVHKLKSGNGPAAWRRHFAEQESKLLLLKRKREEFEAKVAKEVVQRKFGGRIESDLAVFPTKEMTKALNESKPVNLGYIKIAKSVFPDEKPRVVNLDVAYDDLQKILKKLVD